jgi:hypothetical protein
VALGYLWLAVKEHEEALLICNNGRVCVVEAIIVPVGIVRVPIEAVRVYRGPEIVQRP